MAEKPQKELGGPRKMSTGTKVVIGIFAVIMALSMTLPSLTQIFAGSNREAASSEQEAEQSSDESSQDSSQDESSSGQDESSSTKKEDEDVEDVTANVPDNETLKSLAEQNKSDVEKFNKRLKDDPKNLAALLNLAQTYMNWGSSAGYSSSTDEETNYSNGLLEKAIGYFDRYLEIHDSDAARVQRILCESYTGESEKALNEMEKLSQERSESPIVWMYLGVLQSQQGDSEKAVEAYRKVMDLDSNNEYGLRDYAIQSISSIESSKVSMEELTGNGTSTNTEPTEGLPGIIANKENESGTNIQTIM